MLYWHPGAAPFKHYRRSKTNKAPRKRSFVANMTKSPTALSEALESAAAGESCDTILGIKSWRPHISVIRRRGDVCGVSESLISLRLWSWLLATAVPCR